LKKAVNFGLAVRWSPVWAEATMRELQRERPDVVVVDLFLLGAAAAAERAGLPFAFLVHNANHPAPTPGLPPPGTGFDLARNPADRLRDRAWSAAFNRIAGRDLLPPLNRVRADLDLKPLQSPFEQYQAANRVIVLSSRSFDFPASRLPENVRYAGAPLDGAPAGEWRSPWAAGDSRRLVLVNLSSLEQGQGPLMHRILKAVAELPIRALVTLGPLEPGQFEAPLNARLVKFVPHAAVLPSVAVVVSQCGLGTVTKALLQGVPLVCIPLTADQPDNAARVVGHGAGVRLGHDSSAQEIRAAIERVLNDGRFRESARRLGAAMALENGAENAAIELEALVPASMPAG
jgi:UDP:flavonoid glycosyltransferase YjiC (YdhE family)